jgi:hypothetical protein
MFSIISFTESVSENEYYFKLFNKITDYYTNLGLIIDVKICDESTLNGVLNYDQEFIDKVNECEKLQDFKVLKNLSSFSQII